MPPFDPKAAARQIGGILGLKGGLDSSSTFSIAPGAYKRLSDALEPINLQSKSHPDKYARYLAELFALYLPSLLRLVCNNPTAAFDAIHPYLASLCVSLALLPAHSAPCARYVRENPDAVAQLGPSLLQRILTDAELLWAEHRPAIWQVDMIIDLLTLYNALGQHDRLAVDKIQTTDFRILNIPEPLRLQLKARLPRFRAFVNSNPWRSPDTALAAALDNFEIDVEKEKFSLIRGSAYVDFAVKGDVYTPWWVCEAGSEQNMSLPARRCSPGSRDQLRACDRCLSVRYCSPEHQAAHWKHHKPFCVAPTW